MRYHETPIVNGDTASFPNKGQRVRVKYLATSASLPGMQFKVGVQDGAEGILRHIYGLARTREEFEARKFYGVELHIEKDDGSTVILERENHPDALRSIYLLTPDPEASEPVQEFVCPKCGTRDPVNYSDPLTCGTCNAVMEPVPS